MYIPISLLAMLLGAVVLITYSSRRHKRNPTNNDSLLFCTAVVNKELAPDGSILVRGELWPARSRDDNFIPTRRTVIVVGLSDHLLLVEEQRPQTE